MKYLKTLSIAFFWLISYTPSAQSLSSLGLSFALPESYDGVVIAPTSQFDSNNHTWSVGPTILLSYGDQIEQRESTKLTGLYLGYTNFPQGREQKISMFYGFDLWAQQVKDEQDSRYFNTSTSAFEDITIEQKDAILQLFINLGLMIKLSDKISINQVIGTGLNATSRSTTSPFDDFNDAFYSQDWMLKTGFAYRLN